MANKQNQESFSHSIRPPINVLVTGGAGFIGSHACVALLQAGCAVVVLDNFSNSHSGVLKAIEHITNRSIELVEGDVRDSTLLAHLFGNRKIDAVFHFAGLKAVGESVSRPLDYYDCNVAGTVSLCCAMEAAQVWMLVFSSSATVYGEPEAIPIMESCPTKLSSSPYGRSKQMIEQILDDLVASNPAWRIARLRYFNPVGAHESGLIGEAPRGIPNNLMPFLADVAAGRREKLAVFGEDYPTRDGTGVRDYIHVMDLVEGHLAALAYLQKYPGLLTVNLGTGRGLSVMELICAFERVTGQRVPYEIVDRRPGDIGECWADATLASKLLGWHAKRSVDDMCRDTWRWVSGKRHDK